MNIIRWVMGSLIGFKLIFWVIVLLGLFIYSSDIGSLLDGAVGRFDHIIGYTG